MRLEPARPIVVRVDDDGHARDAGRFGVSDGQRLDVEGTAPEQRRDAVQHARLVVDVNRKGMKHVQSAAVSTIGDGDARLIILCRSPPPGTIASTESSLS